MKSKIPLWLIILYIAFIVAVGLSNNVPYLGDFSARSRWVLLILLFLVFAMMVGWNLNKRFDGIFIDSRFKMSLSRFQIILWTLLTFSALFTIAMERNRLMAQDSGEQQKQESEAQKKKFDPLEINFPNELLLALGISTASLAGASIIKNVKKEQETGKRLDLLQNEKEKAAQNKQEAQGKINAAQDLVSKLAVDETSVRTNYDQKQKQWQQQKAQLENDIIVRQGTVDQAKANLQANPTDRAMITALENAQKMLQEKQEELRKATDVWNLDELKYKGSLDFIKTQSDQAGKEVKYAEIDVKRAEEELNRIDQAMKNKEGLIHKNSGPEQADWIDIFRGDEVGNYQVIDVSKVQMFFLTIAIVCTYGVLIWLSLTPVELRQPAFDFPPFSDSMNALLGLSHAGYLAIKGSG